MNIRKIAGCLLFGIASAVFRTIFYWFTRNPMTVSEVILEQSFSWFYPLTAMLLNLSFQYAPFIMFQILFAGDLSEHFCHSGIFFFSRQTKRNRWFIKECLNLAGYCGIYTVTFTLVCLAVASITGGLISDWAGFCMAAYFLAFMIMWLFFHCLLMDLIAIHGGQILGFAVGAILQYGYIFLYSFCQSLNKLDGGIASEEIPSWLPILVWGNPLSHLFIKWHRSSYEPLNSLINYYGIGIELSSSLVAFIAANLVLFGAGSVLIKKKDIL